MAFDLVDVIEPGDIAIEISRITVTMQRPRGETASHNSKHVVVWRQQPDGNLKIVAEGDQSRRPVGAVLPERCELSVRGATVTGCSSHAARRHSLASAQGWPSRALHRRQAGSADLVRGPAGNSRRGCGGDGGVIHLSDQSLQEGPQMPAGAVRACGTGRVGCSAVHPELLGDHAKRNPRAFPFLTASEVA
jgi:hypothetical protein